MGKLIACSGASFSGKTTFIDKIVDNACLKGLPVYAIDENIRKDLTKASIDKIRKDPSKYLRLQIKAIGSKIVSESVAKYLSPDSHIYLADRSLSDSLYYLDNFVKVDQLNWAEKLAYKAFRYAVNSFARFAVTKMYDKILFFTPLQFNDQDTHYRPKGLDNVKEAREIKKVHKSLGAELIAINVLQQKSVSRAINLLGVKIR